MKAGGARLTLDAPWPLWPDDTGFSLWALDAGISTFAFSPLRAFCAG